jgi:hypothetical protein
MLILPLHVTHNLLIHGNPAFDVTHGRDASGRATVVQGPDYTITDSNTQPAGDDLVALLPEGAQTDGAQVMHTAFPIKIATNVNGAATGVQTYVRHNGNIWKAWAIQDWAPHNKLKRYILTRYVNIDGNIT